MKRGCLISPLEYDDVMLRSNRQRLLTFHIFAVYVSVCYVHNLLTELTEEKIDLIFVALDGDYGC